MYMEETDINALIPIVRHIGLNLFFITNTPDALQADIDAKFNPYWGPIFREGYEVSKFGEQVEAYACVYTSRVSNFRYYSPMQYFRGPRDRMPHER